MNEHCVLCWNGSHFIVKRLWRHGIRLQTVSSQERLNLLSKVLTMLKITQANYVKDYQIKVVFNDGACRIFDFGPVIAKYPVFKELSDISKFRNYVVTDTLEWNDGEIDIAPEYLYENGVAATC